MLPDSRSENRTLPFKKKPDLLRQVISRVLVSTGASTMLAGVSVAQQVPVEEVLVQGVRQAEGYLVNESSIRRLSESILDTPQSVTTLTSDLIEDRNAMSLDDALRNVPGITLGAGEFSWQGNSPTIRGFSSRNDMFLDGMRDTGNYSRDPFNLESVQVFLGPSSVAFGRGSTGGVINQSTKKPGQEESRSLHVNTGNAGIRRATADINQPLDFGERSAFRVNLLAHKADVPGRDVVETERYGIAPSLSLGLGNATNLTLSFMHLDSDSIPDYGFPWIGNHPADVDRENFYGFDNDLLETQANVMSVVLDHQFNSSLSLNTQLRYGDYSRKSRITEPQVDTSVTLFDDPSDVIVHRMIFAGESDERMLQGQINLTGEFATGVLMHTLFGGLEISEETSDPAFGFAAQTPFFDYDLPVPTTNLANPGGFYDGPTARRLQADTTSDTLAAYLLDTVRLNDQWNLSLGVRWDRFDTDYHEYRFDVEGNETSSARFVAKDLVTSYRAALVYQPTAEGRFYLGWGTSFNPSAESVSFVSSGRGLNTSNVNLDPEENESLELGTKWNLFDSNLFIDAAIFRITKENARVPDPLNPGFNALAGEQEINGFSINITGRVSDYLNIVTGYTRLDDKQNSRLTGVSGRINNVAENTFSVWANWAMGTNFEIGGGARYVDERLVNNSKRADDYWVLDAMLKYQYTENLVFKLNLTNLTDEFYFDQLHPWHVIPGQGFATVFAINLDY